MPAVRLSVSFDPRSAERLERLTGDGQGKADVVRDALELEDVFREAIARGGRLVVERPDGSVAEIHRPSGPWGRTAGALPTLAGGYTLPPGSNGDRDRRELLARILAVLYSCVGSSQQAVVAADETEHAVQQMVIANAALAAGELDAFLTLVAAGIEGPASVHLRALGELAIRIILCREHHDLALELYRAWGPSWQKLVQKHLRLELQPELQQGEKDMSALEKSPRFLMAKAAIAKREHILSPIEWAMWSKRVHGDIYALVQVSVTLAKRGDDVRTPIIREVPIGLMGNVLLSRAIGFALVIVKQVIDQFGISIPREVLNECLDNYAAILERDEQARAAQNTFGNVVLDSYIARIGGSAEHPVFCDHEHRSPENAAATCLNGVAGDVYELRRGVFTKYYWTYESKPRVDGMRRFRQHTACPYIGRTPLTVEDCIASAAPSDPGSCFNGIA